MYVCVYIYIYICRRRRLLVRFPALALHEGLGPAPQRLELLLSWMYKPTRSDSYPNPLRLTECY